MKYGEETKNIGFLVVSNQNPVSISDSMTVEWIPIDMKSELIYLMLGKEFPIYRILIYTIFLS